MAWWPRLPLVQRELVELAARRRTYVLRLVVLALALLTLANIVSQITSAWERTELAWASQVRAFGASYLQCPPRSFIGMGQVLLQPILLLTLIFIGLLLPTAASLSIALERRQGTLLLVLLTPRWPILIVLEKFCSQVIAACSLLLVVLPMLTIGYVAGGLNAGLMVRLLEFTVLLILQNVALALAVGAWTRSPTGAVLGANTVVFLWQVGGLLALDWVRTPAVPWWLTGSAVSVGEAFFPNEQCRCIVASLLVTLLALVAAWRGILVRQVDAEGAGVGRLLRWLDRCWERIDARWFGVRRRADLPDRHPVRWLEVNRRAWCSPRYLVRLLLPIALVVFALALSGAMANSHEQRAVHFRQLFATLLGLSIIVQAVLGAGLFARDRSDQTLSVLRSTPLTMAHVLREKVAAVARIRWGLAICILVLVAIEAYLPHDPMTVPIHVLMAVLLPMVGTWIGVLCGLLIRDHLRAVLVALMGVTLWLVGPLLVIDLPRQFLGVWSVPSSPFVWSLRMLIDPLRLLVSLDGGVVINDIPGTWVAIAGCWTLLAIALLRTVTLRLAPLLLRRLDTTA